MRTNVVLKDDLVKEAFKYTDAKTKKDLLNQTLEEFINNHKRLDLRDLRGKIHFHKNYDHKKLRKSRIK